MKTYLDWMAAAVAIAEAMCDTSDGESYNENEHLLALPFNGALMYFVDELAHFDLACKYESDTTARFETLERDAPGIEWERAS